MVRLNICVQLVEQGGLENMPSLTKIQKAAVAKKGEWFAVKIMPELRFWNLKNYKTNWDTRFWREKKLSLVAFSCKSSRTTQEAQSKRWTKGKPLHLPCGVIVDKGRYGTNTFVESISLQNIRVDNMKEANLVMVDLCKMFGYESWEITDMLWHNTHIGPYIRIAIHNPDSQGNELYFWSTYSEKDERLYYEVGPYEQQRLCEHLQDKIAHCKLVDTKVISCALKEYHQKGAKN
jgi:hypothetical protein